MITGRTHPPRIDDENYIVVLRICLLDGSNDRTICNLLAVLATVLDNLALSIFILLHAKVAYTLCLQEIALSLVCGVTFALSMA